MKNLINVYKKLLQLFASLAQCTIGKSNQYVNLLSLCTLL